jgi:hypothetical protein
MAQVDWAKELQDLIEASNTSEDKAATEAFAAALSPYLKDPTLLRTLLGKIQAGILKLAPDSVQIVSETRVPL